MTAVLRLGPPASDELDRETIEAARRGESRAQALVVRRHGKSMWSVVCRILGRAGRRHVAEDVAQDALCSALRSLPRFPNDGTCRLSAWMLTIAARTALDELRRTRNVVAIDELEAQSDDRPDRTAEQRAIGRAIECAVDRLSPEIRAAFVLRAYHELEYAEIAEALAIDIGTVKSRLWRARAALQQLLAEVRRGT